MVRPAVWAFQRLSLLGMNNGRTPYFRVELACNVALMWCWHGRTAGALVISLPGLPKDIYLLSSYSSHSCHCVWLPCLTLHSAENSISPVPFVKPHSANELAGGGCAEVSMAFLPLNHMRIDASYTYFFFRARRPARPLLPRRHTVRQPPSEKPQVCDQSF